MAMYNKVFISATGFPAYFSELGFFTFLLCRSAYWLQILLFQLRAVFVATAYRFLVAGIFLMVLWVCVV